MDDAARLREKAGSALNGSPSASRGTKTGCWLSDAGPTTTDSLLSVHATKEERMNSLYAEEGHDDDVAAATDHEDDSYVNMWLTLEQRFLKQQLLDSKTNRRQAARQVE
jgi:hypothetical protein